MGWPEIDVSTSVGQLTSSSDIWTAKHHSSADVAVGNETMKASPSVLTSYPPMWRSCRRITSLCSLMADRIADGYISHIVVEFLMSVNTIETWPVGAVISASSLCSV